MYNEELEGTWVFFGKWRKMSKSEASPLPRGKNWTSSALQTVLIQAWVKMILMLLNQMRMPPFLVLASIMTQLWILERELRVATMISRLEVMMTVKELANYHYLVWNLQNTLQYKSLKKYVNGTFAWMRYINSAYSDGAFISFRVGPMYMVHMYYVFSLFLILTEWPKIL